MSDLGGLINDYLPRAFTSKIDKAYLDSLYGVSVPRWVSALISEDPVHICVEVMLIFVIVYLLSQKSYDPKKQHKLSKKEADSLIRLWEPAPLVPTNNIKPKNVHVVESASSRLVVIGGSSYVNFSSWNFLSFASHPSLAAAARDTIELYGVGSCGPRGFYGSFDVHIDVEKALAEYLNAEECILYSDNIACISSVIPAFCKRGDIIVADKSVSFATQQGLSLSRSKVSFFAHNSCQSLRSMLSSFPSTVSSSSTKINRRFVVVEGISAEFGDICPLPSILAICREYHFRLIVDDSLAIGVIGANGRGSLSHHNIPMADDIILCGTLDSTFASVGGFCVGSHVVVDHQRLSGAGYCFSASSPPYASSAALASLNLIQSSTGDRALADLKTITTYTYARFKTHFLPHHADLRVDTDHVSHLSPFFYIRFKSSKNEKTSDDDDDEDTTTAVVDADNKLIAAKRAQETDMYNEKICTAVTDELFELGMVVSVPDYIPAEMSMPKPSVRVIVASHHTKQDIDTLVAALDKAFTKAQQQNQRNDD